MYLYLTKCAVLIISIDFLQIHLLQFLSRFIFIPLSSCIFLLIKLVDRKILLFN